jgi:hypothetical protein
MQHTLTCHPTECTDFGSHATFSVVTAYEDFETGKHANRTYDFLTNNIGRDCQSSNQMWKFDVLAVPKLREIAVRDVAVADLVVISCHGHELPRHVKSWIDSWLKLPTRPLALVALFDASTQEANWTGPTRTYLAGVAQRGEMEFFAQPDQWPGKSSNIPLLQAQQASALDRRTLAALADVVHLGVRPSSWEAFE